MKMQYSGPQLTNKSINSFEEQFAIRLPEDYIKFLLETNGGMPEADWEFNFLEIDTLKNTSTIIQEFLVLYNEETTESDDLRKNYLITREEKSLPLNFMPIANDPSGNMICICLSEENYGSVFFANHELEVTETGYLVTSIIANSFSDFVSKLSICKYE